MSSKRKANWDEFGGALVDAMHEREVARLRGHREYDEGVIAIYEAEVSRLHAVEDAARALLDRLPAGIDYAVGAEREALAAALAVVDAARES